MNRTGLEVFGRTINDLDDRLPNGRSRCFDIGTAGGCGATCGAFVDGECDEPQEISFREIVDAQGDEDARAIASNYKCFENV